LDTVFINVAWDDKLPSTTLSSLTRTTSDHVPLKIDIASFIPNSKLFRFENFWTQDVGFFTVVNAAWSCQTNNSDPSAVLAAKLKNTRFELRAWRKQKPNLSQQDTDCRIVINLLDRVEESRPLVHREHNLQALIVYILGRVTRAKLQLWKQRSKIRAAIDGDENTRYFHACANQRHRRNVIQIIEHDGCDLDNHEQKATVLHSFYLNLLGTARPAHWRFSIGDLYPEGALS